MTATSRPYPLRTLMGIGVGALAIVGSTLAGLGGSPSALAGAIYVELGQNNPTTTTTKLTDSETNNTVFWAVTAGATDAVRGTSPRGVGVRGESDTGTGVWGKSVSGLATVGQSTSGIALYGTSVSGTATFTDSISGIALHSRSETGLAIRAEGRVEFASISGVATIPAGSNAVTVSLAVDVTADSFVLLTPKVKLGGRDVWFKANATNETITIRMSSSRPKPTKVSWLLLG